MSPNNSKERQKGTPTATPRRGGPSVWLVGVGSLVVLTVGIVWLLRSGSENRSPRENGPRDQTSINQAALIEKTNRTAHEPPTMRAANKSEVSGPLADGWESEAISEVAAAKLKELAKLLQHDATIKPVALEPIIAPDFSCGPLRARVVVDVYRDSALHVVCADAKAPEPPGIVHRGAEGLSEALRLLRPRSDAGQPVRAKLKVFAVQLNPGEVRTSAYYQASGASASAVFQQNAVWHCRWTLGDRAEKATPHSALRLASIEVEGFEEISYQGPSRTMFVDDTRGVLANHLASFDEQFSQGIDYWRERIERRHRITKFGQHGLAIGDVNGDGLEDIYVCQPSGLPNRLYVQSAESGVEDRSASAGVDVLESTRSALLVDLDNDGHQDLVMATLDHLLLFQGGGDGRFTLRIKSLDGRGGYSLSAVDYDRDGDLDLYVCGYYGTEEGVGSLTVAVPYHDANTGGRNTLLRCDGPWRYTDATREVGLDVNNRRFSYAASWEDYDGDGDQDLYVTNDFGRNNLYRNNGGKFEDVADRAGVEDMATGMSASWGDYNRDGRMDLYIGNMFSSAGNRIAYQEKFHSAASEEFKTRYRRLARGNSLFEGQSDGTFRDVSVAAGATMGRWAWGSVFADVNNDGWDDLLVGNGFVTGKNPDDL